MKKLFAFLRRRFTRVTSSVAYIPQLDGLRALAILLVIGHHVFAGYLMQTHRLGTQLLPRDWDAIAPRDTFVNWGRQISFGVLVFFAISGFVLAMPFARAIFQGAKFPSVRLYLLRRLIRLEPPYIIALVLYLPRVLIWRHPDIAYWQFRNVIGQHFLASVTYLHAILFREPSWIAGVAWTLEIEVQFYLLMPLLALFFYIRSVTARRLLLAAAALGAECFTHFVVPNLHDPRWQLSLVGHLGYFFAGILLADLYLAPPRALRFSGRLGDVCAVVSGGLLVYILHWHHDFSPVLPFLVIAFFFGLFKDGFAGRVFRSAWLTGPGVMCYTIYLYHFLILDQCMRLFTIGWFAPIHSLSVDTAIQYVVILPFILLVSGLLYLAVERPCVILSHKLTRRWSSAPPAAPDTATVAVTAP